MKIENARTDRAKPIWPSDYSQAGHKKRCKPECKYVLCIVEMPSAVFINIRRVSQVFVCRCHMQVVAAKYRYANVQGCLVNLDKLKMKLKQ